MKNTTKNNDVVEVLTELTISDVKTLNELVSTCLGIKLFDEASTTVIEQISTKLKNLVLSLKEKA